MFYTYVLQSLKDKRLYIGYTNDLVVRLQAHNRGDIIATEHRRPLKLVYYEACLEESLARRREKQLKTGFGRAYLKNRIVRL